jgi:Tol biopolymer transport system component
MNSARRDRVNHIFDLCRSMEHAERELYLKTGAAGDAEVENEVRTLLSAYDRSPEFLEQPALEQNAAIVRQALQPYAALAAGSFLGHFQILGPIGAGGMGMVYRARDTSLGRDVALKLLPPELASEAGRRSRFQNEARAVAALNHPNIAAIYAIERDALVMELVPGQTLKERLEAGPMPVDEALRIAGQIADGLEAAHEQGLVHRDLKPANIKLTDDGTVKILDFGLAKIIGDGEGGLKSVSRGADMAVPGMILGTAGYMAPEQAAGKPVDKRADIWAFGVVLFEMLVGKPAFDGETNSHRMAAVLTAEPDLSRIPPRARRLLQSCLIKDPKRRLRDVGDWPALVQETQPAPSPAGRLRAAMPWIAAAAAVVLSGVMGSLYVRNVKAGNHEVRADIDVPASEDPVSFAVSPDGRRVVFAASQNASGQAGSSQDGPKQLWVRALDSRSAEPLPGTEGGTAPFWSPDGRSVGFFADLSLKRADLDGAPPRVLAPVPTISPQGTWGKGGTILFAVGLTKLSRVSASGGPVTVAGDKDPNVNQLVPRFLPDGRRFLYVANGSDPGIWLGSLDGAPPRRITSIAAGVDSGAEFLAPNWLVRVRQGVLEAQRFNMDSGQLEGDPVPVEHGVGLARDTMAGFFSVSASGAMVWRGAGQERRELLWFSRSGQAVGTSGGSGDSNLYSPELSPDGSLVATMRGATGSADIWVQNGANNRRVTFDAADERYPTWSPDGTRLAFASNRKGPYDLYAKRLNGSAGEELLLDSRDMKRPNSWAPDGRFLLYWSSQNNGDLFVLPLEGEAKPFPFVSTASREQEGVFSPDGKWVAYQSDASGRFEIYVRPFPGPGEQTQISTEGGRAARWRADGKELYFISPQLKMMAAAVSVKDLNFTAYAPVALFQTHINPATNRQQYDVAKDGRFLILADLPNTAAAPIHLLLNWMAPGQ